MSAYFVFLFTLTIWFSRQWGEATACPYLQMEDVVRGRMGAAHAAARIVSEVAGGILVFKSVVLYLVHTM